MFKKKSYLTLRIQIAADGRVARHWAALHTELTPAAGLLQEGG